MDTIEMNGNMSYHNEEIHPSLWGLSDWEKNPSVETYESEDDEEILNPTKIPRHVCLRMKKRLSFYHSEDDESSDDGTSSEEDTDGEDDETDSGRSSIGDTDNEEEKKFLPLIEVVVHNLPPCMKEEDFLIQVSPLPAYHYKYFVEATHLSWATHVGAHGFMDPFFI